jgi:plasmid replication initiation protein
MPLSQTYSVRATKKLNISSLVDGIDIIQQTRKEAKTVDCTLKISVNGDQKNLQLVNENNKIKQLAEFLSELYEKDVVFNVDNETINDTLGVSWVIMSSYRFMPRAGSKLFTFEFSLTEVKFGDNVLTFDENQIQAPTELDSISFVDFTV